MNYYIYENTRYDKEAQKSIPYSWTLTWSVRTNSPSRTQAKIAGQDRKVFTDKAAMEKYLNGRIKAYDRLFTEISPPIPQEYADYFKVNGMLMPDYTIEGEEPPQQQQAAAIPENTGQEKEREHMSEQFSIMIGNRSRFDAGDPGGYWLDMPATKEQLHEAMRNVGITADNPQDFSIRGYSDDPEKHIALPYEMVCAADVDELNFLAARLEQLDPAEVGKLNAALQQKNGLANIGQVIDFTYNVDFYVHIPEVHNYHDLGDYYLNPVSYTHLYPGYDEYRVNADEIEHDPYVLISILSAWHEGVFTLDEVQSTLEMLFEKQYILTVEEEVQVRYRTETRTDSEGNPYTVEVPYNYYILHVDLENFNLSHVPVYIMGEEQLSMYAMYMSSLGNRPDLFPQSGYISKYYENPPADYEVPDALLNSDEKFARLIEEAEKYVGFPYVWGGSSPETSFDCSGFVSYVLTNSGLYNTGRLGAQGLYNISSRVSSPQPGDLVFFTGTYDTPGVSHVGIYVGEDGNGNPVMLHCGDPIQYSKLNTSYWQSHFYAYGRLNYN